MPDNATSPDTGAPAAATEIEAIGSLAPATAFDAAEALEVRHAQVRAYARYLPQNTVVVIVAALVSFGFLLYQLPIAMVAPWILVHSALPLFALAKVRKSRRRAASPPLKARPIAEKSVARAEINAMVAAGVSGLCWGISVLYLPYLNPEVANGMILFPAGLAAGGATTMAAIPWASRLFLAGCLVPVVLHFGSYGTANGIALATLAFMLMVIMLSAIRVVNRDFIAQFRSERKTSQILMWTQQERERIETALAKAQAKTEQEKSRRRSVEQIYRALYEGAVFGIFRSSPGGRYLRANPAFVALCGYQSEAALVNSVQDIARDVYVDPAVRDELTRKLNTEGRIAGYVCEVFRPGTGERLWIEQSVWVAKDADGNVVYDGLAYDVTDRMRALRALAASEEALKIAKERYDLAVEGSGTGIWSWDFDASTFYRSSQCRILLGDERPDEIGGEVRPLDQIIQLVQPDDRAMFMTQRRRILDGADIDLDLRLRHRNGQYRWFQLKGRARRDAANRIERVNGSLIDIHEQKLRAEELRAALERAQASERVKADFLALMSHEIRTPMNGLIGTADLLLETPLTTEQRRVVAVIRESGETLLRIINDVLDLSKFEAGKIPIDAAAFDIRATLDYAMQIMAPRAQAKHVALLHRFDPTLPALVRGDQGRLCQVLLNLLGNGIKFTAAGEVTLTVSVRESSSSDVTLVFEIADTGIGIPADVLPKLFGEFVQADPSIARRYGGTGLGLAISRRIMDSMNGRIEIRSRENEGSIVTVCVTLPLAAPGDLTRGETSPVPESDLIVRLNKPGRRLRILLAEDNPTNTFLVQAMLKPVESVVLDIAANGRDAVLAVAENDYDIVLMDVHMPVMDGLHAARAIRGMAGAKAAIPIVAITADAFADDLEKCRAAGMNDFVAKPFRRAQLLIALDRHLLEQNGAAAQLRMADDHGVANGDWFDRTAFERLADDVGLDARGELAAIFLAQLDDIVAQLAGAAEETGGAWLRAMHNLKSSAAAVGASAIAKQAAAMESAISSGVTPLVHSDIDRLVRLCEAFKPVLAQWFTGASAPGNKA